MNQTCFLLCFDTSECSSKDLRSIAKGMIVFVFALVLHKALSLSRGITTLFAGGLLTFVIGAGATLAWTVAKDCYPGEARSIRKEEWEVLVTMHARGRSSSGFQGKSRFFQS